MLVRTACLPACLQDMPSFTSTHLGVCQFLSLGMLATPPGHILERGIAGASEMAQEMKALANANLAT